MSGLDWIKIFLFLLFWSSTAQAFLNIEGLRQYDQSGFFGSTAFVVAGAKGNTEKFNANFSTQNIYQQGQNEFLSILNYSYGEANSNKNTDKGSFHLRYTRAFTPVFMGETFYQIQYNDFQRLLRRELIGGGIREELYDQGMHSLYAGQGLFYEDERFKEAPSENNRQNFRLNFYVAYNNDFSAKGTFVLIVYYQPNLEDLPDHRVRASTGLSFSVWKDLSVDVRLTYSYDSKLPAEVKREDFTHYTGFKIKY